MGAATMTDRQKLVLTAVIAAIVGIAVGASATALVQRQRVDELRARVARGTAASLLVKQLESKLDESRRVNQQLAERLNQAKATEVTAAAPVKKPSVPSAEAEPIRRFAFIESLTAGDPGSVVVDYADYLTGKAAAQAAAKAGEESPPPNDYYIVNDSPKLRTLKVDPSATVTLVSRPGEGAESAGYASDVKALAGFLDSDGWETASLRSDGYWLTIDNGTVTAIEEQYTP